MMAMNELATRETEQNSDIDTRIPTFLTKPIADAICEGVRETGVFLSTPHRRDPSNNPFEVYTRDENGDLSPFPILLNPTTIKAWQIRNTEVRETGERFGDMIAKAREAHDEKTAMELRKKTIVTAKEFIKKVQDIPHDKSFERSVEETRELDKAVNGKVVSKIQTKVKDTRVNTEALKVGLDACKFVLERLDPDYMPKQHNRMDVAILTLADLRRYKNEEQGMV
jgi:hypothetical protein